MFGSSYMRFLNHTQRRTTVGRTPLGEWSARRRDLYLTTHNTHNRHPCPPVEFEPMISAGERPQTYALDRAATGTGSSQDGTQKHRQTITPPYNPVTGIPVCTLICLSKYDSDRAYQATVSKYRQRSLKINAFCFAVFVRP
jgi:hypothetical protein